MKLGFLAFVIAVATLRPANADEQVSVRIRYFCENGRLTTLQVLVPKIGTLTLAIPPDICEQARQQRPQVAPTKSTT
jgi:hypothetical protein